MSSSEATEPKSEEAGHTTLRRTLLLAMTCLISLAAAAWTVYWATVLRHYESTDNAYVGGDLVQITPQVGGTVLAIYADDTDKVQAGQPLVKLDPADAQLALEAAQAQLGQTVREVRRLYANNGALTAQVRLRAADAVRARSEVLRAEDDLSRRQALAPTGAVSAEELNHAKVALDDARSALTAATEAAAAAREELAASLALTAGSSVETHPNVQRAAAKVREAYLALTRADLPSPVAGTVARRNVQLGSRVAPGAPLMTVVPLNQVWVEANFKESQLAAMRVGQPVELSADFYGSAVRYHGRVEGLGAGTGAAFALLPAQNATGNWIKVVQRLPVRIALDPRELAANPLRVGLSMQVQVDVSDRRGKALAQVSGTQRRVERTAVFDQPTSAADAMIRRIVLANLGAAAPGRRSSNVATPEGPTAPTRAALSASDGKS